MINWKHHYVVLIIGILSMNSFSLPVNITVDLADTLGPAFQRGSGFLHAINSSTPDSCVNPVKPRLYRSRINAVLSNYSRLSALGCTMQAIFSDAYGYTRTPPGDNNNWSQWEQTVTNLINQAKNAGRKVQWDIWNEPNSQPTFWNRPYTQYYETWRRAVVLVRQNDPGAPVVGPDEAMGFGVSFPRVEWLDYCKTNKVLPDIISIHPLIDDPAQMITVAEAYRKWYRDNNLPIPPIQTNEIIGPNTSFRPGTSIAFFAEIERQKIVGACKACWTTEDCEGGTNMNGCLNAGKPKPVWWAYKCYADIVGTLLNTAKKDGIDAVAGFDKATGTVRIVVGRYKNDTSSVNIDIRHIAPKTGTSVHVKVERILCPNATLDWNQWLPSLTKTIDADSLVPYKQISLSFPLSVLGPQEACVITITNATVGGALASDVQIDSFTVNPRISIAGGQPAYLTWATTNATSVSIDGGVGSVPLDGSVAVSPLQTTTYSLIAQGPGGPALQKLTLQVITGRNSDSVTNPANGLTYKYYEGTWSTLPDFGPWTPVKQGVIDRFTTTVANRDNSIGIRFSGYIDVLRDGIYSFYTTSDDGSKLYIGNTLVVNNDSVHAAAFQMRSGTINLKAGKHAIQVDYFNNSAGSRYLVVWWSGPGINQIAIPGTQLYYSSTTPTKIRPLPINKNTGIQKINNGYKIAVGENGAYQIKVFDQKGRMVRSTSGSHQCEYVVTNKEFGAGVYYATVLQTNIEQQSKMILMR